MENAMKGSIRRRGDSWEMRVYVGVDAVTGKRRYATRSMRGGKREAQRALAEFVTEAHRGRLVRTSATVGELLEAWFDHATRDFSPTTIVETRGFIDRNLAPALGHVPLNRLKAADLDRYYTRLTKSGSKSGGGLSPATVRRIHGILRRALEQAVRWGWIGVNPAASASPPRVATPELRPPSPAEVAKILKVVGDDPEFVVFLQLSSVSGARRSELLALRWTDVDLGLGTMTIRRAIVAGPRGVVEKDTKTHSARRVALDARTVDVLREYRQYLADRAASCGVALAHNCLMFASDVAMSRPCYPDSVSRRFRYACRKAGVEGVRLHDLRHYVATRLLSAGVDVRTVAGRLGHRNAATTLNVYSHFVPETDREAAEIMSGLNAAGDE
jgi:integrase